MRTLTLAAALAVTFAGSAAYAATCTQGNVTYELTQGDPDVIQTAQCFAGNDKNEIDGNWSFGGVTGWTLGDATDSGGDGAVTFGEFNEPGPNTWSVALTNSIGYEYLMVVLKQSNTFGAFLLDTTQDLSGLWMTFGPGGAEGDISHASVYYAGDPVQPAPIPLPATMALLPLGVGALAMVRRRRKSA